MKSYRYTDMDVADTLERLHRMAVEDADLRKRLLETKNQENPLSAFCAISTEAVLPLSVSISCFG